MGSTEKFTTIIDGVTYDITDLMSRHPGGSDMLMLAVNRDASIMFHSYHRRLELAESLLKTLPVVSGTHIPSKIETEFWKTMKARVNAYFEQTKQSSRGNTFMYSKSFALLFMTWFLYYLILARGYWLLSPVLGILMAINGLAIQHDANHGAFSSYNILNYIAGADNDFCVGGSSLMWRHQHVVGHHANPNDVHLDADTYSNFPILKTNPELPSRFYLRWQHFYAPFLYSLLGLDYYFMDIPGFLNKAYQKIVLQPLRNVDQFVFWGGKLFFGVMFFVLPFFYYEGFSSIWKVILPIQLIGSNFLASLFIVSHNADDVEYNYKGGDWAEMQVRTSANWSIHSTAWWLAAGGLNFQIEHHLFPGICHVHYPAICPIVRKVCEEFNVPYTHYTTYTEIYLSHLRGLKKLGNMLEQDFDFCPTR